MSTFKGASTFHPHLSFEITQPIFITKIRPFCSSLCFTTAMHSFNTFVDPRTHSHMQSQSRIPNSQRSKHRTILDSPPQSGSSPAPPSALPIRRPADPRHPPLPAAQRPPRGDMGVEGHQRGVRGQVLLRGLRAPGARFPHRLRPSVRLSGSRFDNLFDHVTYLVLSPRM